MTAFTNFLARNKTIGFLALLFGLALFVVLSLTPSSDNSANLPVGSRTGAIAVAAEPIQPIPLKLNLDSAKVKLGKQLFHDPQLSSNNSVSCATCHRLDLGGTDRLKTSEGMRGSNTGLNSPTVFNSGFLYRLNWDGKAATLEEQMDGPIASEKEMGGMTWQDVVDKLKKSPEYVAQFQKNYGDGITEESVKDAIAVFQHSLYTPNAPFDRYLRGDERAISAEAKQGYSLFKSYGCVTCHQGMLVGGNMFQSLGLFGDYFADRGNIIKADLGRYNVTQDERDRHVFKVPSLRNVTLTSPYFHDGNPQTLDEAIKLMGKYQLGVDLPQKDVDLMMNFLQSLTGEYNGKSL